MEVLKRHSDATASSTCSASADDEELLEAYGLTNDCTLFEGDMSLTAPLILQPREDPCRITVFLGSSGVYDTVRFVAGASLSAADALIHGCRLAVNFAGHTCR